MVHRDAYTAKNYGLFNKMTFDLIISPSAIKLILVLILLSELFKLETVVVTREEVNLMMLSDWV